MKLSEVALGNWYTVNINPFKLRKHLGKNMENIHEWRYNHLNRVENIVATFLSKFFFCHNVLKSYLLHMCQNASATDILKCTCGLHFKNVLYLPATPTPSLLIYDIPVVTLNPFTSIWYCLSCKADPDSEVTPSWRACWYNSLSTAYLGRGLSACGVIVTDWVWNTEEN